MDLRLLLSSWFPGCADLRIGSATECTWLVWTRIRCWRRFPPSTSSPSVSFPIRNCSSSTPRTSSPRTSSRRCAGRNWASSCSSCRKSCTGWAREASICTASASGWAAWTWASPPPSSPPSSAASRSSSAAPRVEKDGKIVGYKISGAKQWISNGGYADFLTILANAPGGPSWFIVERGTPGFTAGKPEDKHGIRLSNTAALSLDEVEVPADHLVGLVEGQGLNQAQAVFGYRRLMVAAFAMGGGWSSRDRAT